MKYKQVDIKEAADRFRNGEAVYAASMEELEKAGEALCQK